MELIRTYNKRFNSKKYLIYNNSCEDIHFPPSFRTRLLKAWDSIIVDNSEFIYIGYLDGITGLNVEYFKLQGV